MNGSSDLWCCHRDGRRSLIDRVWVRGQPMRLIARQGELARLDSLESV